jgi:hypothetical protein
MSKYTATVTKKGSRYLHQVFEDGKLIGKRSSNRTYAFVVMARTNKAWKIQSEKDSIAYCEREIAKGSQVEHFQKQLELAQERLSSAQNMVGGFATYISGYSNSGKPGMRRDQDIVELVPVTEA